MLDNLSYEELKEMVKGIITERDDLLVENQELKRKVNSFTCDYTLDEIEQQYKDYYSQN